MDKKDTTPAKPKKDVLELATEAVHAAKRFLDSDTPAATATHIVLGLVALAPVAIMGAMAPNMFQILRPYARRKSLHTFSPRKVSSALNFLNRKEYLCIKRLSDGKTEIRITKKGMRQVRRLSLSALKLLVHPVWDGKWHLLFYDIPVKFNAARMSFRRMALELGMYPLQKSLWVYPYECESEVLFIARFFGVAEHINFAVAGALFDEDALLKFFKLSKREP